ncbi:MAG TPA: SH3 domain-containing protein [Ignavibacteriaceae bacterium]|nr:SH3 domain-containing protein [Ignavibacteriaceae bacterium]
MFKYFYRFSSVCFLFLFFTLQLNDLFAQKVTPADRVTEKVTVRQNPDTQSGVAGFLFKGETADLLEDVPYWYKIKLNSQVIGYVSKAWTTLSGEITDPGILSGKTDLIIGSWNIKWFGKGNTDKHNYSEMAKIIEKMDVIAIQELCEPNYQRKLDSLKFYLAKNGFKYEYIFSNATGYKNNPDTLKNDYIERYAFMWDKDRINLTTTGLTFVSTPEINNPTFRQVPVFADFKVKKPGGFDFRIMTIHTVYNAEINFVRRAELKFVKQWIKDQCTDVSNPEKNIIVIGDFNANPKGQPKDFAEEISGTTDFRVLFEEALSVGEKSLRTTIQQSDNHGTDYFLLPVYDHALVSNETNYALPNNPMTKAAKDLGVIEFDQEPLWKDLNNWDLVISKMSDHRPVWFKINFNAEDRD